MKKLLISIAFLIFIVVNFGFPIAISAASQDINDSQDEVSNQYLEPLLAALKSRNNEEMRKLWIEEMGKAESKEGDKTFEMLFDLWNGKDWTSVEKLDEKRRLAEGDTPSATIYRYKVMNKESTTKIEFAVEDASKRIDAMNISLDLQTTAALLIRRNFGVTPWLFIGLVVAEIGFSLYVAFLCIRTKPKLWGIWLAFILTIYGGIAIATKGDLIVSFFVYTFAFPRLSIHQNLVSKIYLSVPIGAIIYFIKYKRKSIKNQ